MSVSVYYLLDPRNQGVRYVGVSKDPWSRYIGHRKNCLNISHKAHWIRELRRENLRPILSIKCIVENREEACRIEIALIAILRNRGISLVNGTDGGEDGLGKKWSDEQRKKHSERMRGNKNLVGATHWIGKTHSQETREKLRRIHLGTKLSEETRRKMSESHLRSKRTE